MFGNFTFGEGFFGQPEGVRSSSVSGSGSCSQSAQTCSGVGSIPHTGIVTGGGGRVYLPTWLTQARKRRLKGRGRLIQEPQTCRGTGTVGFVGFGSVSQRNQSSGRGGVRFSGAGSIQLRQPAMRGQAKIIFSGSGSVQVSLMPALSDEQLTMLLLTALD